jgi:hypothetical protein
VNRLPTNEGYYIVAYIVGSYRAKRAEQFLAWKASRVPSSDCLPHQSLPDTPILRTICYINGIIADVPGCDVFHTKKGRLSKIAPSYLSRLLYQDESDENLDMECMGDVRHGIVLIGSSLRTLIYIPPLFSYIYVVHLYQFGHCGALGQPVKPQWPIICHK